MVSIVSSVPANAHFVRQAFFASDRMAGTVPVWYGKGDGTQPQDKMQNVTGMSAGEPVDNKVTPPLLSFGEALDIVNPLHHIPFVGNIYRRMTGDDISPVAQIIGGGIYGGAIGGVVSLVNVAIEEHTGQKAARFVASSLTGQMNRAYQPVEDPRTAGLSGYEKRDPRAEDRVAIAMDIEPKKDQYRFNT